MSGLIDRFVAAALSLRALLLQTRKYSKRVMKKELYSMLLIFAAFSGGMVLTAATSGCDGQSLESKAQAKSEVPVALENASETRTAANSTDLRLQ